MDADQFVHPIFSPALNDKFLSKINLVDLNRFYKDYRPDAQPIFRSFLVDSNFFGNYHSYFTQVVTAYADTPEPEEDLKIRKVLEKDITKFGQVLINLNGLMEEKKNA